MSCASVMMASTPFELRRLRDTLKVMSLRFRGRKTVHLSDVKETNVLSRSHCFVSSGRGRI